MGCAHDYSGPPDHRMAKIKLFEYRCLNSAVISKSKEGNEVKNLAMIIVCVAISMFALSAYAIDPETVVGIWLLDESEGTVVEDSSGNGHDGEIVGSLGWVEGKSNSALEFPGGYVSIPHSDALTLTTFSITAWVRLVDVGAYQALVEKGALAGDVRNYYLAVTPDGLLYGGFKGANGWNSCVAEMVVDEQWHHVAVTYDMESILTYVDGASSSEITLGEEGGIDPLQNDAPVTFGVTNTGGGEPAQGIIDEVAIFNDALSEADVKNIMKNGLQQAVFSVEPSEKLAATWGGIRSR